MTLKRKKKREYYKELKIVHGVFDEHTLMNLYWLLNKNGIKVESSVKEGKESLILSGLMGNKWVAIKVYRTTACDFKVMWKYLIGDMRFSRLRKDRRAIVKFWCQREFKNLKIAHKAGVNCPKPLFLKENIMIMDFIGENNMLAPRLVDIVPEDPESIYKEVIDNLKKLVKAGVVHGDLSAYNILFWDKSYFIDFSHGTDIKNQMAPELLKRDIKNINSYFSKLKVKLKEPEKLFEELKKFIDKK